MQLEDIYKFFQNPPPYYLNRELAICYVLSVLLEGDSYGSELIQSLEREHSLFRLSDTVLYSALKFLEDEELVTGYWKKVEGRGRPRRMYQLTSKSRDQLEDLAHLWRNYLATHSDRPLGRSDNDVEESY
jgi:DNA-binding PadR family transcriptional regulator